MPLKLPFTGQLNLESLVFHYCQARLGQTGQGHNTNVNEVQHLMCMCATMVPKCCVCMCVCARVYVHMCMRA